MGCDIHSIIEQKIKGSDMWVIAAEIYIPRDYQLFTVLANVRNEYKYTKKLKVIADPKGLPDEFSYRFEKMLAEWEGDGHSHSWLTFRELEKYNDKDIILKKHLFYIFMTMASHCYGKKNIRIVFFFDN